VVAEGAMLLGDFYTDKSNQISMSTSSYVQMCVYFMKVKTSRIQLLMTKLFHKFLLSSKIYFVCLKILCAQQDKLDEMLSSLHPHLLILYYLHVFISWRNAYKSCLMAAALVKYCILPSSVITDDLVSRT
jgi:hypothetical protein